MNDLDFAAIRTDLVLSWRHRIDCGQGAEFPWDCTCDYQRRIERMEAGHRGSRSRRPPRPLR